MAVQADWQCKVAKRVTRKVKSSIIYFTAYQWEISAKTTYINFFEDDFNSCVHMWTARSSLRPKLGISMEGLQVLTLDTESKVIVNSWSPCFILVHLHVKAIKWLLILVPWALNRPVHASAWFLTTQVGLLTHFLTLHNTGQSQNGLTG